MTKQPHWKALCLLASGAAILGLGCPSATDTDEETTSPPAVVYPFPANFDYPRTATEVEGWVNNRDGARIRQHGWYLWAGLNHPAPNNQPVWRSWPTSTQTYATGELGATARPAQDNEPLGINAKNRSNAATEVEDPINFDPQPVYPIPTPVKTDKKYSACYIKEKKTPKKIFPEGLKDGERFEFNGDIMVAGVIYDESASQWIRSNKYYLGQTLHNKLPQPGAPPAHITPAPHTGMVLKPMMWPVRSSGYTALPVWDELPPSADDDRYAGYEIQAKWTRAVAVTPDQNPPSGEVEVEYLYGGVSIGKQPKKPLGPNTYRAATVPVTAFYHHRYSQAELDAMDACDRAILDSAAYWAYNRSFQADDYLVTIAMHIITKEQPQWTFQSVWWHDQPNQGRYSKHRPNISKAQAPGPWDHYLMTSTYGMLQIPGHDNDWPPDLSDNDKKWPVAYNPYIELAAGHPIATNCMNCHLRAAWPSQRRPVDNRQSSYLAKGAGFPDALDEFTINDALFNGLLTLDAQWAMADRAHLPPTDGP